MRLGKAPKNTTLFDSLTLIICLTQNIYLSVTLLRHPVLLFYLSHHRYFVTTFFISNITISIYYKLNCFNYHSHLFDIIIQGDSAFKIHKF